MPPSVMTSTKMDAHPSLRHELSAPTPLISETPRLHARIISVQVGVGRSLDYPVPVPVLARCPSAPWTLSPDATNTPQ